MFFLLMFLLGFVLMLVFSQAPKPDIQNQLLVDTRPKNCPPHKWSWKKTYNPDGTETGRERIVCELCGPLRGRNEQ